jgi:hypothetical protein
VTCQPGPRHPPMTTCIPPQGRAGAAAGRVGPHGGETIPRGVLAW